ncbi:hypothetical protein LWP59_38935 [Amycolatopsis acidiphila]|uniref:Uncharacterized protein n=1 Tax=Amycolatopsis acidiphila TaxID=715473 RepID=A0A558AGP4_9PSEU|nr:hypothetical protein [Amycolatopsis acidiphila]TVT23440.1 hypothetical protein FNH06_09565 [Amycolatopsis acidiphila]UIJ59890.1 hypothetical protein LWP59_38935 [Amycolatopsis acidiphila]GHG62624.1 hypothetical protein GCM10017788_18320 [Amycolatopsis acidiphila]
MADGYPDLRIDRYVTVVQGDQHHQARLRGWLDGHDGTRPIYRLELLTSQGTYGGPYTATGPDMFEALVRLRRQLEPEGLRIAIQGSRRDAYPSGMARDMGGGERVYVLRPGRTARRDDLVDTFAEAPPDQLATVDEQRTFWEAWLKEADKA